MSTKRMSAILTVLRVFLFTSLVALNVQAATYRFKTFDAPSTPITPTSINDSGQVTGYYSGGSRSHGFVYSNGTFKTFDVPGATDTFATSINNSGQVTGFYDDKSAVHGFVYSGGTFMTLTVPGSVNTTRADSINDEGQVAGSYSDGSTAHGFVYSGGTFTTLTVPGADSTYATSINASGQVTGHYFDNSGQHGFVYSGGTFTTFNSPGAFVTMTPTSINDSGQVTGHYVDSSGWPQGFVYSSGTFTTLTVPGTASTLAYSINDKGQITGTYREAGVPGPGGRIFPYYGFVYSSGAFTTFDVLKGLGYNHAASINANGQVTGFCDSGAQGFIATPVCATPTVAIHTLTTAPNGGFRITGSITLDGAPLCALVLANGQFMFTCGEALPEGDFDLTVPLDDQGKIALFGFSAGLAPFQQTVSPSSPPP